MPSALPRIGIIGIGQIGSAVAHNLLEAGYEVCGFRRSPAPAFEEAGGVMCASAGDVVRQSDVVLMCLPNESAQSDVLQEILSENLKTKCFIELGTYAETVKRDQAEAIQSRGGQVLEAEISGSPIMVRQRKAALYIGAAENVYEQHERVLDAIAEHRFLIGDYGSAVKMKLIANYLLTIHTLAAAEAMSLGEKVGFDPNLVASVISQGGGSSAMFAVRAPMMAARKFTPAPGPFTTLEKYLELCQDLVQEVGATTPLFACASQYFHRAIQEGIGEEDIAAVIKLIEADAAVS